MRKHNCGFLLVMLTAALVIACVLAASAWFLVNAGPRCPPDLCPRANPVFIPALFDASGFADVVGVVVDDRGLPFNGEIRLCDVVCDGEVCVFGLDIANNPGASIGLVGDFRIRHVQSPPPYGWVIAVGRSDQSALNWKIISTPDGLPIVWQTYPGETLDTGVLWIER